MFDSAPVINKKFKTLQTFGDVWNRIKMRERKLFGRVFEKLTVYSIPNTGQQLLII